MDRPATKTITLFSLPALKEHCPEAYAKVLALWKQCTASQEAPWATEVADSITSVVKACGGRVRNWVLDSSFGRVNVEVDDYEDDGKTPKGPEWFKREVLKPNGYLDSDGNPEFPGRCRFTGYCFDDDCLESVWMHMSSKSLLLSAALARLGVLAGGHLDDAREQQATEESMHANWDHCWFTATGQRISEKEAT